MVFTQPYAEERPSAADKFSTEIIVTVAKQDYQRRYHGQVPTELESLRDQVSLLIQRVRKEGTQGLYHQGRPLPNLPPRTAPR